MKKKITKKEINKKLREIMLPLINVLPAGSWEKKDFEKRVSL